MDQRMQIDETITVGGQPDETQLKQLAEDGFKTIVNLRTQGEDDQPLSPGDEGSLVRELGLQYVHYPVDKSGMNPELVDKFRDELPKWQAPVFVHCNTGKRAGAFVMMDRAVSQGWSGEQTLKKAEQMGFECKVPEIKELVSGYVDSRQSQTQKTS
jgi:uncharacterized protein (TIGR01244 family)